MATFFSTVDDTVSGSCNTTVTWTAGDSIEFISPPIYYSILSYYDEIEIKRRYNDMVNTLHVEENRKDLFTEKIRQSSRIIKKQPYTIMIPSKRNFRGQEAQRK